MLFNYKFCDIFLLYIIFLRDFITFFTFFFRFFIVFCVRRRILSMLLHFFLKLNIFE